MIKTFEAWQSADGETVFSDAESILERRSNGEFASGSRFLHRLHAHDFETAKSTHKRLVENQALQPDDVRRDILLPLWDHGWLDLNVIALPECDQPSKVVLEYLESEAFGSSIIGPERDPSLHGPFWSTSLTLDSFETVDDAEFKSRLESIRTFLGPGCLPTDDQWCAILAVTERLSRDFKWIVGLKLTEADNDKFHEWGWVFELFREFLLANPGDKHFVRLIFGFD